MNMQIVEVYIACAYDFLQFFNQKCNFFCLYFAHLW